MSSHVMVTLSFTRPVEAHELCPGDTFAFPDAPRTPLTVLGVDEAVISPELTLVALTVPGHAEPMNLPANTPVRVLRMLRTVSLPCLLCGKSQDIELDLPRDGEPLSVVCADHVPDPEQSEETG
ncbi:hypothetical protein Sipo8835_37295 [Streptomyces ipomoeae]|uniref:Uncharacterized protein n=1 Tax=Streptomyces ipomoeae TaxID=103232 RepID=A0AAE9AXB4_9ACTN|nr:hypothetical protein [Streptomyces ipomoeae]TQE21610.1 hypothetical protein Sipo8835_37295 [Streptomyces ipomoeae]